MKLLRLLKQMCIERPRNARLKKIWIYTNVWLLLSNIYRTMFIAIALNTLVIIFIYALNSTTKKTYDLAMRYMKHINLKKENV